MKICLWIFAAVALGPIPVVASTLVDFNAYATTNVDGGFYPFPFSTDGFTFTSSGYQKNDAKYSLFTWNESEPENADLGGATLNTNYSGEIVTVTKDDGSKFELASVDLAKIYNGFYGDVYDGAYYATFNFFDGVTTTSKTIYKDDDNGFETFVFNVPNLVSFSYQVDPSGGSIQADNFLFDTNAPPVVNPGPPIPPAVAPEPAQWVLLLCGFASIGFLTRRAARSRAEPGITADRFEILQRFQPVLADREAY